MTRTPPQPAVSRITPFAGHPLVVGVEPEPPDLLPLTAASLAAATGAPCVYFAYADPARFTVQEYPDGTVRHEPVDADSVDDSWSAVRDALRARLTRALAPVAVPWELRYLAGRPDRALTHLARAVDAAAIVVGTRAPGAGARIREFVEGSVAVHLAHHQHRPVITVPLSVVDWKDTASPWDR
ncbi:universal stress protein [Nocardiopsis sp. CC223A]|uniref:universal stress protein n=1 Tax=Nocardiopsis sp. CC223A TaxID=3044051 RepID=UPI00278BC399|nr:universal stress protein [Nocardiopsis sp. CC223A]